MSGQEICIIVLVCAFILLHLFLLIKTVKSKESDTYIGKAKLIVRFSDEQGCFLCEFEKNGKIINAVYGFDREDLKVGDEVEIVWNGKYTHLPHVMDKEVYEREEEQMAR